MFHLVIQSAIAMNTDEKIYILQVTESMMSEDMQKRELAPLQNILDNYEKIVLSLDPGLDASYIRKPHQLAAQRIGTTLEIFQCDTSSDCCSSAFTSGYSV